MAPSNALTGAGPGNPPAPVASTASPGNGPAPASRRAPRRSSRPCPGSAAIFVAYWHAAVHQPLPADARLWVSGVEAGGSSRREATGSRAAATISASRHLRATLGCPVFNLPPLADWTALTYEWAVDGWRDSGIGRVLATYAIRPPDDPVVLAQLRSEARLASHFYWSSAEQFYALRDALPGSAHHACGAGKTLRALQAAGVDAQPFPNGREWRQWLN